MKQDDVQCPCEAVFISDLHLDPNLPAITERFFQCLQWAKTHTKSLYILGDFFHAWAGDDAMDAWSIDIAEHLKQLADAGVKIYFMPGNRDFLLGKSFLKRACMRLLPDPTVIVLHDTPILLSHGDRYCSKDTAHQWFRRLTRNAVFIRFFLSLPLSFRERMVKSIRKQSQAKKYEAEKMSTVADALIRHMQQYKVHTLIHGHTHRPGLTLHTDAYVPRLDRGIYKQYILSDWDDSPQLLCYDITKGLYFIQTF